MAGVFRTIPEVVKDFDDLGIPPVLRSLALLDRGLVLLTGPTGSGKTTTLYSALSELNEPDDKIITTEDPIEYDIEGIVQVPSVSSKREHSWA